MQAAITYLLTVSHAMCMLAWLPQAKHVTAEHACHGRAAQNRENAAWYCMMFCTLIAAHKDVLLPHRLQSPCSDLAALSQTTCVWMACLAMVVRALVKCSTHQQMCATCRTDCWCTGVITYGQDGPRIAAELQEQGVGCIEAGNLQEAVATAQELAQKGQQPSHVHHLGHLSPCVFPRTCVLVKCCAHVWQCKGDAHWSNMAKVRV